MGTQFCGWFLFKPLQKLALPCYAATCIYTAHVSAPALQRTRATKLACWLLQSPLYQPTLSTSRSLIPVGKRPGGGSLLNDGSATPTSLVQPLGFAQFNCRRLWGSHDAVHDGFMGLVSCLDQLHVRVVCVQETQAQSLGTLPVDQSFRYDGPLGNYGREAGFLFHSSIDASCIPGVEDSQSLRWRLVAGAICVCSFYALHAGIALDVRVAFWRNLAATV